jgi:hypothetical protein
MPRIPAGEQFGQVVTRPGPVVNVNPDAYGAGVGRAIEQAGNIGMQIAGQDIAQANAEAKQLAREQEAEAKQFANEAKRVKALTATAQVQGGLATLHDQLSADLDSGAIDKADVGSVWAERSTKLVNESLANVDPQHRELVNATLLNDVGRYGQSISKMVVQRDKKDIMAGGLSYFESMQRHAARGPKQADEAIANVSAFWKATGPMAGEDPAAASLRVQRFTENVRTHQATGLVNADPAAALKALKNPNYLPELDPDKRSALINTADAMVLRNQQRGALQAEAAARAQTKAWEGAQAVFQAGKMPTPEYAAQLSQTFKGTPYAVALKSMLADGPANVAFVAQPVQAQAAGLAQLQNKLNTGGATPEDIKNYERLDKAHKATLADIKEDPYKAASERGVLTSLDPLSLDIAQLPAQLAKRAVQANTVSTWAGREVSLFRPDEAAKVANVLQAMPPKDRAGALAGISKAMTPGQMRAFGQQMGSKDETLAAAALLSASGATTTSGRQVAEIALAGADAMKEDRVKFPAGQSKTTIRAEIDKATRGAYLSEDAQRAAGDAAMAVYAGLVAEGQSGDVGQAVRLTTGGVMEINGAKFVKPYGWQDSQVLKALRDVDAPKMAALAGGKSLVIGGKPVPPEEVAKYMPGAQLGPSRKDGHYTVSIGGRLVTGEDGKPFLLPLAGGAK